MNQIIKSRTKFFAWVGFGAGIGYSFGGAVYDYFTIGLNTGTALAFLALIGMPFLFALFGLVFGIIESLIRK